MFTFSNSLSSRLANQRTFRSSTSDRGQLLADASFPEQVAPFEEEIFPPAGSAQTIAKQSDRYATWIDGFTEFSHQDSQNQTPAFNIFSGAALIGFDYYGSSNGQVGAALGYARNSIHDNNNQGSNT